MDYSLLIGIHNIDQVSERTEPHDDALRPQTDSDICEPIEHERSQASLDESTEKKIDTWKSFQRDFSAIPTHEYRCAFNLRYNFFISAREVFALSIQREKIFLFSLV
jgi:hypothetical protein